MNGDRSEQRLSGPWSSAGLSRSYSEHAALVLRHFERQRDEPKYSRSGPDFRIDCHRDEEETITECRDGQRTWRVFLIVPRDSKLCFCSCFSYYPVKRNCYLTRAGVSRARRRKTTGITSTAIVRCWNSAAGTRTRSPATSPN